MADHNEDVEAENGIELGKIRVEHSDTDAHISRKTGELAYFHNADPKKGLDEAEVEKRREEFGYNELEDDKVPTWIKFLSYFTGPMPIIIWIAILIEIVEVSLTGTGVEDLVILIVLQFVNGVVGFIEEQNAGDAVEALRSKLKPTCRVVRHSGSGPATSRTMVARDLVPGDVIELKLGDVCPADCLLLGDPDNGKHTLQVDESALTGESLPRTAHAMDKVMMSAVVKTGERPAVVVATGKNTYFGKAAGLMNVKEEGGRFQHVLFLLTAVLVSVGLVLCTIIFFFLLFAVGDGDGAGALDALSVTVVLLIASVPVALLVVSTAALASGSKALSQEKAIVTRLSAIEELAGMSVLCSDKTGTLTLNKLELNPPFTVDGISPEKLIFYAALAANLSTQETDAIDKVILDALPQDSEAEWGRPRIGNDYVSLQDHFMPFDPSIKRTEATIRCPDGSLLKVSKGAPQVILRMCLPGAGSKADELKNLVEAVVDDMADRGFRALGVAIAVVGSEEETPTTWEFQGVLSLTDPPRKDTAETVASAIELGVEVKMITGDQKPIAVETLRRLKMGTKVFTADVLDDVTATSDVIAEHITAANGFAEVMPEHKFNIVQALRKKGLVVGMTGDGVNDAPALKRADIGIAVDGATDAAKAAADIVLTEPGLSVIVKAIVVARAIFQRLRVYCIYRAAGTLQILGFSFIAVLAFRTRSIFNDSSESDVFVLPAAALVVITLLNDICVITLTRDKVKESPAPQSWDLPELAAVATTLGFVSMVGTVLFVILAFQSTPDRAGNFFGLLLGRPDAYYVTLPLVRTAIYLKISVSDFLTIFSARHRGFFWERPASSWVLLGGATVALGVSSILAELWPFGDRMAPLRTQPYATLTVWVFCVLNFIVQDAAKVLVYNVFRQLTKDRITDVQRFAEASRAATTESRATKSHVARQRSTSADEDRAGIASSVSLRLSRSRTGAAAAAQRITNIPTDFIDEFMRLQHEVATLRREMEELRREMRGEGGAGAIA